MKREQKGSVTMIVLVTLFFIVIILSSFFIYTSSRRRAQLEETQIIANSYDGDMNTIYEEIEDKYVNNSDTTAQGQSLFSIEDEDSINNSDTNANNLENEENLNETNNTKNTNGLNSLNENVQTNELIDEKETANNI